MRKKTLIIQLYDYFLAKFLVKIILNKKFEHFHLFVEIQYIKNY